MRFKIKIGQAEVEYEGDEKFLKEEFSAFIKTVSELRPAKIKNGSSEEDDVDKDLPVKGDLSTGMIAQKLGSGTGSELAFAAAVKLSVIATKSTFSRKEILAEMQSAKSLYKKTFMSNLGASLKSLCKSGKLNEVGNEVYSLHEDAKKEVLKTING